MKNKITIFAKIKILYMIEIDKKLHKDIKEYCQLNGMVMKDFVNKLLKKAFAVEKYGDKPFAETKPETGVAYCPYIIDDTVQVILTPGELPEKIKERYSKPISDKFYGHIQVDGLITEIEPNGKIGENTEIVDMRSVISDGNDDKIILQPSKDGKSLVSHPETESVQEEIKEVKKSKKRKL